eukprot:TRINITY_DN23173_c0_g2_i3.p2 TRINITY_DN23173_c0_g2~~TRINITY_DN23173_c0_g2_i3.p2  ORF type:complete len:269 (+),score=68.09 TRINITY_DN23173_c0_g2_i3:69-875(+)
MAARPSEAELAVQRVLREARELAQRWQRRRGPLLEIALSAADLAESRTGGPRGERSRSTERGRGGPSPLLEIALSAGAAASERAATGSCGAERGGSPAGPSDWAPQIGHEQLRSLAAACTHTPAPAPGASSRGQSPSVVVLDAGPAGGSTPERSDAAGCCWAPPPAPASRARRAAAQSVLASGGRLPRTAPVSPPCPAAAPCSDTPPGAAGAVQRAATAASQQTWLQRFSRASAAAAACSAADAIAFRDSLVGRMAAASAGFCAKCDR